MLGMDTVEAIPDQSMIIVAAAASLGPKPIWQKEPFDKVILLPISWIPT
jgi:hypothetical protein